MDIVASDKNMPASKVLQRYGERIRGLRKEKDLTQQELAERADLHLTYVGAVERGRKNISLKNVEKLAKGLGVSLAEFFSTLK